MTARLSLAVATIGAILAGSFPATAQITVRTERRATNFPTSGFFQFTNIPTNSASDLAHGKSFTIVAGTQSASSSLASLTDGPAQTGPDMPAQSFFAIGNTNNGTEKIRIRMDLEVQHDIGRISSYSWHANSRAPQSYRVYGASFPANSAPDFNAASFQNDTALAALGYTRIAEVKTATTSGGQYGATVTGPIGQHRYLLFDIAPTSSTPRPTFMGEIDIYGTPVPPVIFPLAITPATSPATGFDLRWDSRHARAYRIRTATDFNTPTTQWDVLAENVPTTPPENSFHVPLSGPRRFYTVEEVPAPPVLLADFETNNGGFTTVTESGSNWEYGTPSSGSPALPNAGGFVNSGNNASSRCWGTAIASPGLYQSSTVTRLRSPVIDLGNAAAARLTFAQALDLAFDDTATVNIIHATNDTIIAPAIHTSTDTSPGSANWSSVPPIPLSAALGQPFRLEWVLTTQTFPDFMGWYIDDVRVFLTEE